MSEYRFVGMRVPLVDAESKVRGEEKFAADVEPARLLIGQYLPSPHAHAEILSVDTRAAEAVPGVVAVITGADAPRLDKGRHQRLHGYFARKYAVYAGQPVAAVAAEDATTAEAALDLIDVEYQQLPVLTSPEQAMAPNAQLVATLIGTDQEPARDGCSPNAVHHRISATGNADAALATSDEVAEGTFQIPMIHQGYIEPHSVVAHWDRHQHLTVWESVQGSAVARTQLAEALKMPVTSITVNTTAIGGGFGGKSCEIYSPIAALLAKKARRAVRLTATRHQEMESANPAPSMTIRLRTGANRDGSLTAVSGEVVVDAGAFPQDEKPIIGPTIDLLWINYRFPARWLEGLEVLTNKVSYGPYRAPGAPQAAFALESQIDELAAALDLDPIAFRRQNLIREGEKIDDGSPQGPTGAFDVLDALECHPAWTQALPTSEDGLLRGRGVALGRWGSGPWPGACVAELEEDGQVRIVLGTVDLTGSHTSLAQIAAEELGISPERIIVTKASLDHAPYAAVAAGSGTIYGMGRAVQAAVSDLRAAILNRAASEMRTVVTDLDINDDRVFVASNPNKSITLALLYQTGTSSQSPLVGLGSTVPSARSSIFAATVADIVVDPETGRTQVLRLTVAQDTGTAINPMSVEGQLQGGTAQGVGMALWEQVMYDAKGRVRDTSFMDYTMPTTTDLPAIDTVVVEAAGGAGPFGAKGVGEPPIIPAAPAIANAIAAAIGIRIRDLPITSEKVWRAIGNT